jgi:SAM-dependent methyltransferase
MQRDVYERLDRIEDRHWWFVARRAVLSAAIERLGKLKKSATILEAGCGTGGNLAMLSGFGDLVAFEPDEDARKMASHKHTCEILEGYLPEGIPYDDRRFDLIAAFDVIEHVERDIESLAALRNRLNPGGRLIMSVPALPWLWSAHDEHHHHFRRYTWESLQAALHDAGFRNVEITYYNTLLFPLVAGVRAIKKLFNLSDSSDDHLPAAPVNAILRMIFASERFLIGRVRLPIGVSLLAVAEGDK